VTRAPGPTSAPGFTLIELLMVIAVLGIVLLLGVESWRRYRVAAAVDRAVPTISADVGLARSVAVRRRSPVSVVFDEAGRSYAVRVEATGDTVVTRRFGEGSEVLLSALELAPGSSLTFDARGLLAGGSATIRAAREDVEQLIELNATGRSRIVP